LRCGAREPLPGVRGRAAGRRRVLRPLRRARRRAARRADTLVVHAAHLAARIRASRAALEGERKLVTVLFADVVGSTSIAERIGPEEMRTLIDRCFGHMLEGVHRYEGTVNQFTGDGIMALFGAPLALEDAPRRAVLSALEIQRAIARDRAELGDLQVRIGIHTGLVVVGRIGNDLRMEYTAIGDTTNLAARLQSVAAPGVDRRLGGDAPTRRRVLPDARPRCAGGQGKERAGPRLRGPG
jgi:class 3 adenylate cyclase